MTTIVLLFGLLRPLWQLGEIDRKQIYTLCIPETEGVQTRVEMVRMRIDADRKMVKIV